MLRSVALAILGLLTAVPGLLASDEPGSSGSDRPTSEAEYQSILKDFQAARDEFKRLLREAKSGVLAARVQNLRTPLCAGA
jgi:hypothetical protein